MPFQFHFQKHIRKVSEETCLHMEARGRHKTFKILTIILASCPIQQKKT